MPNKLIDLTVEKIAFVDEGDNPEANMLMFKRKPADNKNDKDMAGGTADDIGFFKKLCQTIAKLCGFDESETEGIINASLSKKAEPAIEEDDGDEDEAEKLSDDEELEDDKKQEADKSCKTDKSKGKNKKTGGYIEMSKLDKSKLNAEELAQLEAIEKKALIEDDESDDTADGVEKNADKENNDGADDDIYKGLHPAVKAEMERLKKRADEAEQRELLDVAKSYEIIGKKPDELAETLKVLKAAGGSAYNDMIATMDAAVEAVEKAGVFSEIGKNGDGANASDKAWAQIEKHAKDIQKSKPELSWEQAVDTAAQQHPELVQEYEDNI